jgi:sugar phosphate isomerase/epimerase
LRAAICSIIWKERMDIFEVVRTAARVGAEGIEVWGQAPHIPDPGDLDHVARIREAMATAGIFAPQYGSYTRAATDEFITNLKADLAIAENLGSPAIRMWAGRANSEECDIQQWEATIADLKAGCAMATDAGLLITLERHGGTVTNTLWGCQRTLDEVDSPALKINYQVGTATDTATLAEEIRILGPHILNTHATNHRMVDGVRFSTRLEDGDMDWAEIIENLKAAGNDGFVEIEFARRGTEEISLEQTEAEVAADIAFLKKCMAD